MSSFSRQPITPKVHRRNSLEPRLKSISTSNKPPIIWMNVKMNVHVDEGLWLPFDKPSIGENY